MRRFLTRTIAVFVVATVVILGLVVGLPRLTDAIAGLGVTVCPAAGPIRVGTVTVPRGPVAGYCQDRLVNAAHIVSAARALGLDERTQEIGVMTAIGESGLRNLSYGDVAGTDSRGLFQQRDNGAWGSLSDRMTPTIAAHNFFVALERVPNWRSLTPSQAAHAVQVNADPDHYTRYWSKAVAIVTELDR